MPLDLRLREGNVRRFGDDDGGEVGWGGGRGRGWGGGGERFDNFAQMLLFDTMYMILCREIAPSCFMQT